MKIIKKVLELTVLMHADDEEQFSHMSLETLGNEIDEGTMIGATRELSSEVVPDEKVMAELKAIGNDGYFFGDLGGENLDG